MSWIATQDTLVDDPRLGRIAKALGVRYAEAAGCWSCLRAWASRHRQDGVLEGLTDDELEHAARWDGEVGAFIAQLLERGLLVRGDFGVEIAGWMDEIGSWKAADKKRKQREAAKAGTVPGQSRDCPPDQADRSTDQTKPPSQDSRGTVPGQRKRKPAKRGEERSPDEMPGPGAASSGINEVCRALVEAQQAGTISNEELQATVGTLEKSRSLRVIAGRSGYVCRLRRTRSPPGVGWLWPHLAQEH